MSQPLFMLFALIQGPDIKLFSPSQLFLPLGHSLAAFPQWRGTPDLTPNLATTNTHLLHHFGQTQTLLQADVPACQ